MQDSNETIDQRIKRWERAIAEMRLFYWGWSVLEVATPNKASHIKRIVKEVENMIMEQTKQITV